LFVLKLEIIGLVPGSDTPNQRIIGGVTRSQHGCSSALPWMLIHTYINKYPMNTDCPPASSPPGFPICY